MAENPKTSLKITIPALKPKGPPSVASEETMEDQPSKRKRKVPTRYLDGGDYEDDVVAGEPEKKVPRTSTAGRSRRQSTASEPASVPAASNLFDDEDVEDARAVTRMESEPDDAQSEHSARQSSPVRARGKTPKKGKAGGESATSKKKARTNKRAVVVSDTEDEEAYMDTAADVVAEESEDDEYMSEEDEKPAKKGKGKAAAPKRTPKAPAKKKTSGEPPESAKSKAKTVKKPAGAVPKADEGIIDVIGGSSPLLEPPTPVAKSYSGASKQDSTTPSAAPTPAPKKRLPTINKVKGSVASGLTTPPTPIIAKKAPAANIREDRSQRTDVNLNDTNIYQALFFKGKTGGNPNAEERRKELNKMREEAKAKRKAEAAHSFDLQAQAEKIALFEETLRNTHSLFPNVIAGRFRQAADENRRMQREQDLWAENTAMKEEGEVT